MLLRPFVQRRLQKQERPSRTRVFTALYSLSVAVFVVLVPITLVFPSVRVVDVLASLGVVSVAVGFAFKDVLENLLAGFLLLLRDPFKSGDQIKVAGYEGTVEGITVRETLLRTTDGERVLIPNAHVYTGALVVQTHYPTVRLTFRLLVDPHANPDLIRTTVTQALTPLNAEGAPPPDVVLRGAREGALEIEGPPVVQIRPRIANRCPGPRPPGGTASISRRGHRPGPAADRLRSRDPRGQPRQRRSRRPHVRAGEGL
ncbi:mechanosensitive ion channel [Arthrobacter sp. KFRI-F3372]|uniref:mechanosensitive ion channel family protein n=1 Tax=Arthrobacter oryzae TaxID=409290 RepID=UPI0027A64A05|nr:mechanosensitive ion channel domain-containing protein [Arthrobacter oryzae]WHP61425.1 mechanosensitive ion channel [Arthrobacter sp. KFRI-F3372]